MALELPRNLRRVGGLWEVTSARGHRYFRGGTRGGKIYIFENRAAGPEDPPWLLYVDESQAAGQEQLEAPPAAAAPRRPRKTKPRVYRPPASSSQPLPDDPLADLFVAPRK